MPAITTDTLTLPRIARPDPAATAWRPVERIVTARPGFEGEGFPIRRPFPGELSMAEADPFILLDHMGAVEYAPGEAKGTSWHPHRGFETVTYLIDGAFEHQDSTGGGGLLVDGATQWMTAGGGILHIERPPAELVRTGGLFHGVQLWVNLPRSDKLTPPRYQGIDGSDVTLLASADGASLVRLIAGDLDGHRGPGATWTPISYAHATVAAGAELALPWPADFNALVYVLSGRGSVGSEGRPLEEGQLAKLGPGDALALRAADVQPASSPNGWELLLLGGRPLREPIFHYGPFVMNTRDEVAQAIDDFNAGRLGQIPAEPR